ncbi:MAG: hypothetical protein JNL10_11490 [Verrucomicrobiales bacterium]|nr:hypothetical protein [Verrucomicrobiales bacterium]
MTPVAACRLPRRWKGLAFLLPVVTGIALSILQAHRLDECLQATFVTLWPDHLELDLVLTPGMAVAPKILPGMDRDADGVISPTEADDYATAVLGSISLKLDGTPYPLRVTGREFPELELIRAGQGAIRIQLAATFPPLSPGGHTLTYRNSHLTHISVYLVNATLPPSPAIRITGQHRDPEQQSTRIEFTRTESAPGTSRGDGGTKENPMEPAQTQEPRAVNDVDGVRRPADSRPPWNDR